MANSIQKSKVEANAWEVLATEFTALMGKVRAQLGHNSDQAIDWGAQSTPAYIEEDADGNINGLNYSRQNIANLIGSFDQVRALLDGETPSTGDHLGNFNNISRPNPFR